MNNNEAVAILRDLPRYEFTSPTWCGGSVSADRNTDPDGEYVLLEDVEKALAATAAKDAAENPAGEVLGYAMFRDGMQTGIERYKAQADSWVNAEAVPLVAAPISEASAAGSVQNLTFEEAAVIAEKIRFACPASPTERAFNTGIESAAKCIRAAKGAQPEAKAEQAAIAFDSSKECSPLLTMCPRCKNPQNACDQGKPEAKSEASEYRGFDPLGAEMRAYKATAPASATSIRKNAQWIELLKKNDITYEIDWKIICDFVDSYIDTFKGKP